MLSDKHGRMGSMLWLLVCIWASMGMAQMEFAEQEEQQGPDFHMDLVSTALEPRSTASRLNLYLEIVNDDLQFVKTGQEFLASFETTVIIYDKDDEQVEGTIWKEKIDAANYDATNKRNYYHMTNRSFLLDPGKYKLTVIVQDLESKKSSEQKREFEVPAYAETPLSMSDLILISEIEFDTNNVRSIRPQVSDARKGIVDSTLVYFELYQLDSTAAAKTDYELYAVNAKKKIKRSFSYPVSGWRNPVFFSLHADSLPHDLYRLKITTTVNGRKVEKEKAFYIRWSALPTTASDLNSAIEQARYIATKDEWKLLKKAKGEARLPAFLSFWRRHDPTPGTEANESMDAYYSRVEYANRYFSVMQRQGWQTDMGIIYIILGPPDDVERNSYPRYSKPYEIWSYYRYSREFLFFDFTGFGDYRLETPMSIYEFQRLLTN